MEGYREGASKERITCYRHCIAPPVNNKESDNSHPSFPVVLFLSGFVPSNFLLSWSPRYTLDRDSPRVVSALP